MVEHFTSQRLLGLVCGLQNVQGSECLSFNMKPRKHHNVGKRIINHPPWVQAPREDNGKRAASRSFPAANGTVIPKAEALSGCHSQTYSTIVPRSWTRGTLTLPGLRCHILHETQFHDIKLDWTCLTQSLFRHA
jgi:hypothetical protein